MDLILNLFCLVTFSIVSYIEAIKNKFRNLFSSLFILAFYLLYILVPILRQVLEIKDKTIYSGLTNFEISSESIAWYYALCLSLSIGFLIVGNVKTKVSRSPKTFKNRTSIKLSIIVITGVVLFLNSTGMSLNEMLNSTRFSFFAQKEFNLRFYALSFYLVSLLPISIAVFRLSKASPQKILIFSLMTILVILYTAVLKDRKLFIFLISALLFLNYWFHNGKIVVTKKQFIGLLVSGIFLVSFQFIRHYFVNKTINPNISLNSELEDNKHLFVEGDLSYFYLASLHTIERSSWFEPQYPLALLRRNILFALPSSIVPIKGEDISLFFAKELNSKDAIRSGNMPPGFLGLFILSFGKVLSLPLLLITPLIFRFLENFILGHKHFFIIGAYFLSSALYLLRGDDSSALYYPITAIIILILLNVKIKKSSLFLQR